MTNRRKTNKRPCRICRKWFMPDPRLDERQKTCGGAECMRKWHTKKCAEWNRKNRSIYFQANYLSSKLAPFVAKEKTPGPGSSTAAAPSSPPSLPLAENGKFPKLPRSLLQEVIGRQHLVIIEYMARLLFRSVQEVIRRQPVVITTDLAQLPPEYCLRSDSVSRGP